MNKPIHRRTDRMDAIPDNAPPRTGDQLETDWDCFTCWRSFDGTDYPLTRHPNTQEPECSDCRERRERKGKQRTRLTFTLDVWTTKEDSLEVLAHSLLGDLERAAREQHEVNARAGAITKNGKRFRIRRGK